MFGDTKNRSLGAAVLLAAGLAAAPSCLELRDSPKEVAENPCAQCHGSARRDVSASLQAAPPNDLKGNRGVEYPGVGAHQLHLVAGDSHPAFECSECHEVPEHNDAEGHFDSAPPAEVVFGPLAALGERAPRYDAVARTCANSYCHGETSPVWTKPRDSGAACGSCHGLPPKAPHPSSRDCATCHGEVVDRFGEFIAPERHVDGQVQVTLPGCTDCHGRGGDPAPPRDLSGNTSSAARGVGAHQVHLSGGENGRPLACDECHRVPEEPYVVGHLDGRGVNVDFSAFAVSKGPTVWDTGALTCNDGWCHTPSLEGVPSPSWTSDTRLNCNGCHAMPPTAPHPPVENCALCHADVINAAGTIIARELHVDGVVQLKQSTECTGCHGQAGEDPLGPPPRDTLGNSGVEARGVGAHAAHLVGRGLARVLECAECHRVPTAVEEQGHIDSPLPAEVTLTGVAAAFAAEPSYDAGRCAGSYCHGDRTIGGRPSGGQHTVPEWTSTDDSQISCQSCHGMPPPAPHPDPAADCGECHKNADGNDGFLHPELHVDGKVTFFLSREDAAEHFAQEVSSP